MTIISFSLTLVANPCYARNVWGGVSFPPDQQRWSPVHAKVKVDCWSSLRQSSPSQDQQRQLPFHAKVKVDCWSSLRWSLIPPAPHHQHKTCSRILITLSGTVPNFIFFNILINILKLTLSLVFFCYTCAYMLAPLGEMIKNPSSDSYITLLTHK